MQNHGNGFTRKEMTGLVVSMVFLLTFVDSDVFVVLYRIFTYIVSPPLRTPSQAARTRP